nr:hypothetical protein [Trinickia mobilis]
MRRTVAEQQDRRNRDKQTGNHLVQQLGTRSRCPACAPPGAEETAGQQVHDHRPVREHGAPWHCVCPKGQRRRDNDEAHRLVENHRFQRAKLKCTNKQRQAKLRTAETNQSAKGADDRSATERGRTIPGHDVLRCHVVSDVLIMAAAKTGSPWLECDKGHAR